MKNLSLAVLIIGVAVLASIVFLQQRQIDMLKRGVADKPIIDNVIRTIPAPTSSPSVESAMETRRTKPVPPSAVTASSAPITSAVVAANTREPTTGNFFANISSMVTNPAMKEMIRVQTKMQLATQYDQLFKYFDIPQETIDTLKDILLDRQMALVDGGMAFMGGNMKPEERMQKAKEMQTVKESYDKKIEELLGADDYDSFKQYEATQPERMQVEMFRNSIASSGEPLTEQQEYDLVSAMYQNRTNTSRVGEFFKHPAQSDPEQFSEANMNEMLKYMNAQQSQNIVTASTILSPSQLTEFKKYATQQQEMNAMGIKFAAQMFGGSKSNITPVTVKATNRQMEEK